MDQRIIDLYDAYTHGGLVRRDFLDRVAQIAGGPAAARALLPELTNDYARAAIVGQSDPRLASETVDGGPGSERLGGYLTSLRAEQKRPVVLVIHENRGLNPHIRDVARRFAIEGFLAFAADALSPLGGTPADEDKARELIGQLEPAETVARFAALVPYLAQHARSNGRVGAVGFCWGGGIANHLAAAGTRLGACVSYYGMQLPAAEVPRINVPLLLHYAGLDERINVGIHAYRAALDQNKKVYEMHMYGGVNHAFNNDTNAARYDKAAADLAWSRTVAFLKKSLG